jgi:predicted Zn-dependent peptidase
MLKNQRKFMLYESDTLPNGLRIIHQDSDSPVSYCGYVINVGTRDEFIQEFGMAHFLEHMLFKGTEKRKSHHILNRMENVGGELNAYTTKEETFIYSVFLEEDFERAIELLSDLVFHSQFPDPEIEKEREIILDEINSYKDNPSELIFDDFENILFSGHEIGHNILGEKETLQTFNQSSCKQFFNSFYQPTNMVFFSTGRILFSKVIKLVTKYSTGINSNHQIPIHRKSPESIKPEQITISKDLFQTHVLIGTRAYDMKNINQMGLYLLNNILGGPGMNSRLNVVLRENHGLVYNVESNLTSYTDTGIFSIYFGCDNKNTKKCLELTDKEIRTLCKNKLTDNQLSAAKKQLKGQLGIARDNKENLCLSMGKSFLHRNHFDDLPVIYKKIDNLTASQLLVIANEIFDRNNFSRLIYQ